MAALDHDRMQVSDAAGALAAEIGAPDLHEVQLYAGAWLVVALPRAGARR